MPIRTTDGTPITPRTPITQAPDEGVGMTSPDFGATLGSAWRLHNEVYNALNYSVNKVMEFNQPEQPGFNPYDYVDASQFTEDELLEFADTKNISQMARVKGDLLNRRQYQKTLEDAGLGKSLAASVIAAGVSPLTAVPVGLGLKALKGGSIAKTALVTGASTGVITGASELSLQATQEGRTAKESVTNILAGTLFGMGMGAAGGALNKAVTMRALKKTLAQEAPIPRDSFAADIAISDNVNQIVSQSGKTLEELTTDVGDKWVISTMARGLEKSSRNVSPSLRLMGNDNIGIRDTASRLLELNTPLKGTSPISVESRITEVNADLARALEGGNQVYKQYIKAMKGTGERALKTQEFFEQVGYAARRGDEAIDPNIAKAAKTYRKTLIDKLTRQAQEVKLLPEDVAPKNAQSYLSTIYKRGEIVAREHDFRLLVNGWIKKELLRAGKLGSVDKKGVEEMAADITAKIKGLDSYVDFKHIKFLEKSPLKERTLDIDPDFSVTTPDGRTVSIEEFLENDIRVISRRFARLMKPEIELKREFSTTNFQEVADRIQKQHRQDIAGITDPEQLIRADKQLRDGLQDLADTWDIVRGSYRADATGADDLLKRSFSAIRTLNYLATMGKVTLASIGDFGSVMRNGYLDVYQEALKPMAKNLASGRHRLTKAEALEFGQAVENVLSFKLNSMMNITDPYARGTMGERMIQSMSEQYGNYTLINYWNNMMKEISLLTARGRSIRYMKSMAAGKALTKKEQRYMNFLGIDDSLAKRILAQIDEFGEELPNGRLMNFDNWTDGDAGRSFRAALNKRVDHEIIVKKAGDAPIVMNTETGKVLGQFMNFQMASNQKYLLSLMSQADFQAMQGIGTLVGLGMLIHYIRTPADKLTDDPKDWVKGGFDRSGVAAIPFWMANIAGQKSADRAIVAAGGVTASKARDLFALGQHVVGPGDVTQHDLMAAKGLIPFNNHFALDAPLKAAVEALGDKAGIKKKKRGRPRRRRSTER